MLGGIDNLEDGKALPVTQVEAKGPFPFIHVTQRQQMRLAQIVDVDVIAYAGAVGGRVILPENL